MNFDFQKMMKQAQKLQEQMGSMQKDLETMLLMGKTADGSVTIESNARFEFKTVTITPEAAQKSPAELEALVLAALQDLGQQVAKVAEDKMGQMTAGLKIPGLKLPGMGG
jgi:nucleoid-associated protein EbfC